MGEPSAYLRETGSVQAVGDGPSRRGSRHGWCKRDMIFLELHLCTYCTVSSVLNKIGSYNENPHRCLVVLPLAISEVNGHSIHGQTFGGPTN